MLPTSYRVSARQPRERGQEDQGAALDARADALEDALMDSAREALGSLERHATYTRTGHHSARTGEWRDGDGLVASLFLHVRNECPRRVDVGSSSLGSVV